MTDIEEMRSVRDDIVALAHRRHINRIRIADSPDPGENAQRRDIEFGENAQRRDIEFGNIDIIVNFEPDASLVDQVGFMQDLELLVGSFIDVISAQSISDQSILANAVDL